MSLIFKNFVFRPDSLLLSLSGGVLNLVLAFPSLHRSAPGTFFNIFHIHVITGPRTFCIQPGTACPAYAGGCGIVGL